jgi:S1-C subfamily serine protease
VHVGGDAIVAIDGVPVTSAEDVVRIVATRLFPGERARFTVVRGSVRRVVAVTLGERPPTG